MLKDPRYVLCVILTAYNILQKICYFLNGVILDDAVDSFLYKR